MLNTALVFRKPMLPSVIGATEVGNPRLAGRPTAFGVMLPPVLIALLRLKRFGEDVTRPDTGSIAFVWLKPVARLPNKELFKPCETSNGNAVDQDESGEKLN